MSYKEPGSKDSSFAPTRHTMHATHQHSHSAKNSLPTAQFSARHPDQVEPTVPQTPMGSQSHYLQHQESISKCRLLRTRSLAL